MQNAAGIRQYQQVNVTTASRGQLLLALYETAVRFCGQSAESIRRGDVVAKAKELQRVSAIISELTATLNHSVAPDLCANLEQLYLYMQDRISDANANMDDKAAEEVGQLLETLRSAWVEAVKQVENNG